MCKKLISLLLLFVLLSSVLFSQSAASSLDNIEAMLTELETLEIERQNLLNNLTDMNNERLKEIEEREKEMNELRVNLKDLAKLEQQRQQLLRASERKLIFWRTTSIILGTTTLAGIITIAVMASK